MTVYKDVAGEPSVVIVNAEEIYRTPLLPGFELPLGRLLKLADDWAASSKSRRDDPTGE
jgi:hypothetical protein